MTKHEFCKDIVGLIDNMNYIGETKDKQIEALISPLKPKELKRFAK